MQISGNYISIYTSYELTSVNNMTINTCTHIFHIIGICHQTDMPATLHMYVALNIYCTYIWTQHYCKYQ